MVHAISERIPINEGYTIRNLPPSLKKRWNPFAEKYTSAKSRFGGHRGYWYRKFKTHIMCEHVTWWMFPLLPKRFQWNDTAVRLGMYIDAWYSGDRRTTAQYEKEGAATDLEMPDVTDPPLAKRVRTSATRLFSALALQDQFDVPLWGTLTFITDGRYLVPANFISQLIAADPKRFGHLDANAKWEKATPQHLQKMGLKPEQVTSGMYLKPQAAATSAEPADEDPVGEVPEPQSPPRERTLLRRDRVDYIEWVTEIEYEGQAPYFCRRLYRDQQMLYEATSYSRNGPWTVYTRDNSTLLALGIDP